VRPHYQYRFRQLLHVGQTNYSASKAGVVGMTKISACASAVRPHYQYRFRQLLHVGQTNYSASKAGVVGMTK
ncbi:hypothetical protein CKJ90_32540, partial [Klebsiella pneumoniae]